MREILFRGFCENFKLNETVVVNGRTFHGEWVYGYFIGGDGESYDWIQPFVVDKDGTKLPLPTCEVISETVGQFTGLLDKNGKKIFEGDIVRLWRDIDGIEDLRTEYRCALPVSYCELWSQFVVEDKENKEQFGIWQTFDAFEVIGTIFDVKEEAK